MFSHPEIWILAVGIFLGFFAQGIVGFAASVVAFPFLLKIYTLPEAVAFLTLYLVLFSLILGFQNRHYINKKILLELIPGVIIGFPLGIYLLKVLDPVLLERLLGVFLVFYAALHLISSKKIKFPEYSGSLVGLIGGISSGMFNSAAGVVTPYIDSRLDTAAEVRGTLIGVFIFTNFLRLPLVAASKILTWPIFKTSLLFLPVFFLAIFLGQKFYQKLPDRAVRLLILGFLGVSGVVLILK